MVADIMRDKKLVTPRIDFLTKEGSELSRPVPRGTLVLVCSGGPESVGLPGILTLDACIHDGIIALKDIDKNCRTEWLFHLFNFSQPFMDSAATHGGAFVNLTTDIVKRIQLGIPPETVQDEYIARPTELERVIDAYDSHLDQTNSSKGTSRFRLMSFNESNTVEQMILDAVTHLGRVPAAEPGDIA